MKICPYCGSENLDDYEICNSCGVNFFEEALDRILVSKDSGSFEEHQEKCNKIGGWLVLIALGRVVDVLTAPISIWYQYSNLQKLRVLNEYTDVSTLIAKIGISYSIILFIVSVYLLILMSKGKRSFKYTMISCLLFIALYRVVQYFMAKHIDINVSQSLRYMVISIVSSIVWILYFLKSERVKGTFIK